MVGFIGMFKKAKSGAKLLGSGWKNGAKGIFNWAKNMMADDIIDTFKSASQIASNLGAGARGAGWVVDKFPVVGALGSFGKTAGKGFDWTSNLLNQGTKMGQWMKGEKRTGVKHKWYDQFI